MQPQEATQHLEPNLPSNSDSTDANARPTHDHDQSPAVGCITRARQRRLTNTIADTQPTTDQASPAITPVQRATRRFTGATAESSGSAAVSGKRKQNPHLDDSEVNSSSITSATQQPQIDRKGKKKAVVPTSPVQQTTPDQPASKRSRKAQPSADQEGRYSLRRKSEDKSKGERKVDVKGKSKEMPKKANPRQKRAGPSTPGDRSKKGESASKHLIDDPMDDDESAWLDEPEHPRPHPLMDDDERDDEGMEGSGLDEEDEDHSDEDMPEGIGASGLGGDAEFAALSRRARESGMHLDEATAAAIFGGGFRAFGGMMSGLTSRFKRLKNELRSSKITTRLSALRECSELLLVSNEDTLGGSFSPTSFATEFIAILKGQPNIDPKADEESSPRAIDDMDEDAQLAAALAMSTGGAMPSGMGQEEEMECQLVACRCLAHLLEALPGSGHTLVHLGAIPVLCSKLTEIEYIELAEQTLSTMEKIAMECPSAVVQAGGLSALLNFLPFFSTNVQRTAVTAAANCCRNISTEYFAQVRDVFPTLRDVLTQADQRLVEQATLAVVRTIEAYRHSASNLEGLLDVPTVVAVNSLLMPSGGSPLLSPGTYTHLLKALTTSARGSAKVAVAFLEAGMTNTIHQILTGVLPSSHEEDEQGGAEGGQGLSGGVADMAVLQNLAHRPKDQVEEALALICELLPPTPRDGVFDSKAYSEKSLHKLKKGRRSDKTDKTPRRSIRNEATGTPASTSANTPAEATIALPPTTTPAAPAAPAAPTAETTATAMRDSLLKAKKEADAQVEQRVNLFKAQPELVAKFIKAMVPVLVDVYAASVAARVRTKVLSGLTKAIAFAEPDILLSALKTVPMASFLCAIISSKDNTAYVLSALQLVELLAIKLPDVYQVSLQREGVVFEIEALAAQELSTAKAPKDDAADATVKKEPEEGPVAPAPAPAAAAAAAPAAAAAGPSSGIMIGSRRMPLEGIPDDLKPLFAASGLPAGLSSFLMDGAGPSTPTPKRPSTMVDPHDANILRARVLIVKKIFSTTTAEDGNSATAVLDKVGDLVKKLNQPKASDGEIRDALTELGRQLTSNGQALSSFELLKSGLVDGLLEFVDVEGAVSPANRRAMLFDILSDTASTSPSPLVMLVKRLHESLSRLEEFQVEVAFNGVMDSTRSTLSKTMRVRLQAEEGTDVPKGMANLVITIQAIAPLQALHDYLRQRVADGHLAGPGGGSGISNMIAAYASGMSAGRGGMSGADLQATASRMLDALAASRGDAGRRPGQPAPAAGAGGSSLALPPPVNAPPAAETPAAAPTRRRSARLSAQGTGESQEEPQAPSTPPAPELSTSAPEATILPGMPMDMDFDEEEGFTDEEYDAEVYEDEMEEELARPQEKVVNMSVAPDGSRVEAKTPEGTRITTPSQAAAQTASATQPAAAGPSGSNTPRTGSYAGAVKTAPTDWHLEFSINGNDLPLTETVYGVAHKHTSSTDDNRGGLGGQYGAPLVIRYRKKEGPAPTTAVSTDAIVTPSTDGLGVTLDASKPTSKILRLLRVVHNLTVESREATGKDQAMEETLFVNNKLTAKLTRQLEEIMIIASNCLPEWAVELPKHFSFLFPFETRYGFLQNTSFGYGRLLARYQAANQSRNSRQRDDLSHLARLVRQKVRISRPQLLESCAKVMELYGTSSGMLEIEYFDEIGTGLGPTLEFYSIASREFARRSLSLWRDEDDTKAGNYVHFPKGLFPAPISGSDAAITAAGTRLSWFKIIGLFVGRALLDSRIIDVNLNKVFLRAVLGQPIKKNIATLRLVDPALARSLEGLQSYLQTRKDIESLQLPAAAKRNKLASLTIHGVKLVDLSLDFTLPGYPNVQLKPDGALVDVDDSNLEEYLDRVLEMTLGEGIDKQVKAFKDGFSMIFSVDDMKIFSPDELGLLFGNADEDWSKETLEQAIKADHGYNLDSRAVQNLIQVMSGYDKEQRRQFLQFITGAPKLPIGGFRGLSPPFTVVKKPHEAPFRADDYLPSVMTCAQYLKMPDYSNKEVLAAQIQRAMLDGGGSFHLS